MDAIVTAGGVPDPEDVLYPYTQGEPKALLDMAGKPMIQWVLDALCESKHIGNIVIIGLTDNSRITCEKALAYMPSHGDMVDNIRAGVNKVMEINPNAHHVLLVSSDIPAITADAVDWVVETTMRTDQDVYYNLISRETMEKRFPDSRRSYVRLKDVEVCGGDMNVVNTKLVTQNDEFWKRIVAARKNAFKQAALIGFDTLLLLLFKAITLKDAETKVLSRLNLTGQAILCPYAEVGMDVDKPHQLEALREDLTKRQLVE